MNKKIAVDVDEVLLEFVKNFLAFYNFKYQTSFKKKSIFSYDLEIPLGITRNDLNNVFGAFYNSPYFRNLNLVNGAQKGLSELSKNNEVVLLTSRSSRIREETESFVNQHFFGSYSSLLFSKSYLDKEGETKAEICKKYGFSLLVDDCLKYSLECNELGIPSFLFDTPWNKGNLEGTLITRVKNWNEILEKLKQI